MENQEEYSVPSRAELIKLARESCTKNLSSANSNNKNQNSSQYKAQNKSKNQGVARQSDSSNLHTISGRVELPTMNLKLFIIRMICAVMIFLTVLIIDKLDIKFQELSSDLIEKCISTNQGMEDAEEFFVSCFEQITNQE